MLTEVLVNKGKLTLFTLNMEVFRVLFDHTVARRKVKFINAVSSGVIEFDDFLKLTRSAEVPYPLFFLSLDRVNKVILDYEKKVYFGVSKDQMSIATRGELKLADIALVLKDITRKQNFLKKYIDTENELPGLFKRNKGSVAEHAEMLRAMLGYDLTHVETLSKEKSFNVLNKGLADMHVYISLYAHNYTPQTIEQSLQFSGITINDKKCPYLFIKAGDNNSKIELWGRRLFTAALLLSCLCEADCRPVTMDGKSGELTDDKHFIFAEEFLMPEVHFSAELVRSLSDVDILARKYSVSNSAIVMRLFRLKMISEQQKDNYLATLQLEWDLITKNKGGGRALGLDKAINRYNNPAVVKVILDQYYLKKLSKNEARNLLCYKKGDAFNIGALQHV